MAIVIVTTIGSASANSYISLADANTYHKEQRYHTYETWLEYGSSTRSSALVWATRLLDEQVDWEGTIVYPAGALRWPRYDVWNLDGYQLSQTEYPTFLEYAVAEYAYHLLVEDRTEETNRDMKGFKEMRIGDLHLIIDEWTNKPVIPPAVWSMVKSYGSRIGRQRTLERM
jgi:hypothetical protein